MHIPRRVALLLSWVLISLALGLPGRSGAALVPIGWVPDSWGLLPFPRGTTMFHFTRRIVADPTVASRFALGHLIFGLYQSDSGGGWVSSTPHCLSIVRALAPQLAKQAEDALDLLGGCGVEGLAFDQTDPLAMYASTYNFNLGLQPDGTFKPSIEYGGVYRAFLQVTPTPPIGPITTPRIGPVPSITIGQIPPLGPDFGVSSGGIVWKNILDGVRGNAVAVKHLSAGSATTIVVGRIQRSDNPVDVGTDTNEWCTLYKGPLPTGVVNSCSPSLYISYNGGRTWETRYFNPPAGCPNSWQNVTTSSALVGNIAFDPENPSVIYAGANSGLYVSIDNGVTWSLKLTACGSSPGFDATFGDPGTQRLYAGNNIGEIFVATTNAPGTPGPGAFTKLKLSQPIAGRILTVMLDARDMPPYPGAQQRDMFVASWTNQPGPGTGGVYKVHDNGDGTAKVTKMFSSLLEPFKPTWDSLDTHPNPTVRGAAILAKGLLPYPLFFDEQLIRTSLFLEQHPLAPDFIYASTVAGGVWLRAADCPLASQTSC